MTGIKGYTFYDESLSGTKLKIFSSYIRYPLLFKNDNRILQFSVQNISLGYVFQVGNADDNDFMSSNGIENSLIESGYIKSKLESLISKHKIPKEIIIRKSAF